MVLKSLKTPLRNKKMVLYCTTILSLFFLGLAGSFSQIKNLKILITEDNCILIIFYFGDEGLKREKNSKIGIKLGKTESVRCLTAQLGRVKHLEFPFRWFYLSAMTHH